MKHFVKLILEAAVTNWHKPVLCDYHGETFEFADVATNVAKLHIIFRKLNIKPGDKIAICGRNCARWAIIYLAAVTYRAVAVPILTGFTTETLESLVEHSESVLLFLEKGAWKGMKTQNMPRLIGAIAMEDFSELYSIENRLSTVIPNIEQLFKKKYPQGMKRKFLEIETGELEDLITISYTSGTTSSPKGIMLSAKNISSNVVFGQKRIQIKRNSTMVSMLPLAHLYGLTFEFLYPMASGCSIYFLGKTPSPTLLLGAFKEVQPTMMITVPLVLEKIMQKNVIPAMEKPIIKIALSIPFIKGIIRTSIKEKIMEAFGGNMNVIIVGGAAISGPVEILLKQLRIPYTVGYGMTECGPLIGYEDWYDFAIRSCGKPVDGMQVRIDSNNQHKDIGEIQVKGDNVMMGYYKNDAATKAVFTDDGWMKTGDLGIIDRYGNIYIKGRSKNMILSSNGQNIYPEEIEELLNNMPHVRESIVISRDKHIIAIVAVDNDDAHPLTKSELQTIMKSNLILLNHKLPNYSQVYDIEMLEDDFERTPKNSIKRFLYK
ncbi:MAG: AMP-binding protein [Alistipes sp.]|nr:AMP-binding protein [Candidatus Alistipes equi]